MPVSVGARVAASRAGRRRRSAARNRSAQAQKITQTIAKYDKNDSGKLEPDQLQALLTDLNGGTDPGQEAVDFVLRVADKSAEGSINHAELIPAIGAWKTYVAEKGYIDKALEMYDENNSEQLEPEQMRKLLIGLNEGQDVSEEDVKQLLGQFDKSKTGAFNKPEIIPTISAWYANCEPGSADGDEPAAPAAPAAAGPAAGSAAGGGSAGGSGEVVVKKSGGGCCILM